jgi:acetylglutamate kinase
MTISKLTLPIGVKPMEEVFITKASHLIEALPYIRRFYGKTIVIKCGGAAIVNENHMQDIMQDLALLYFCGIRPVVIHGGGPEISEMCKRLQIPVMFSDGHRITDKHTLEIVQMVLLGKTNRIIVSTLNQHGVQAVGLSGHDAAFLQAKKIGTTHDLGFVGDIVSINQKLINTLLNENFIPVIAPIGVDQKGQSYNINGDIAASAIAASLIAEKLIILTDVNGIYTDVNDHSTQVSTLKINEIKNWFRENKIAGGMIPKMQACINAIEQGVPSAHILSGKLPHSLLLEIFTDKGVGTMITA